MKAPYSLLLLTISSPVFAATNLIDLTHGAGAGGFELGDYVRNGFPGNHMHLTTAATTMTGWVVAGAQGVDWVTLPDNAAYEGVYSVDLSGDSVTPSIGSVTTTIPTVIGSSYTISFEVYGGVEPLPGQIIAGNLNETFLAPGNPDPTVPLFTNFEYSFDALEASTAITFSSTPTSYGFGPVIDDVSVVPEPTSPMYFMPAIALLFRRRQRCVDVK